MGLWRGALQKKLLFSHLCSDGRTVVLCPERTTLAWLIIHLGGREDRESAACGAIQILALQLSGCVTLGKFPKFSEPQFYPL